MTSHPNYEMDYCLFYCSPGAAVNGPAVDTHTATLLATFMTAERQQHDARPVFMIAVFSERLRRLEIIPVMQTSVIRKLLMIDQRGPATGRK